MNDHLCGDAKCQAMVEGNHGEIKSIKITLFGVEGSGGLVSLIHEKMPKKWLWIMLIAIGLPTIGTGIRVWSDTESAELKYATREESHRQERRLDRLEQKLESMFQTLEKIDSKQDAILDRFTYPDDPSICHNQSLRLR